MDSLYTLVLTFLFVLPCAVFCVILLLAFTCYAVTHGNKSEGTFAIHNHSHASSFSKKKTNNSSCRYVKSSLKRPVPAVPLDNKDNPEHNHSYFYPNIAPSGFEIEREVCKSGYEQINTNESHSYYCP